MVGSRFVVGQDGPTVVWGGIDDLFGSEVDEPGPFPGPVVAQATGGPPSASQFDHDHFPFPLGQFGGVGGKVGLAEAQPEERLSAASLRTRRSRSSCLGSRVARLSFLPVTSFLVRVCHTPLMRLDRVYSSGMPKNEFDRPDCDILSAIEPPLVNTVDQPEMLTKVQVARRLQKTPRCVESWMRRGYLPYLKVGRSVLFRWPDVVESLNRFRVGR